MKTTTEHKQYIVTLRWPSARPVPKYGNFIWNANLHRLVWRNEIAETMGQLAELTNQAVVFVREQDNNALLVEVVPVPAVETEETLNAQRPTLNASMGDADTLARHFHETYERLAPSFGYQTRKASAVPWEKVPEQNKNLMRAVCSELLASGPGEKPDAPPEVAPDVPICTESGKPATGLAEKMAGIPRSR